LETASSVSVLARMLPLNAAESIAKSQPVGTAVVIAPGQALDSLNFQLFQSPVNVNKDRKRTNEIVRTEKIRYLISLPGDFYLGRHCRMLTLGDFITAKMEYQGEDMVNDLKPTRDGKCQKHRDAGSESTIIKREIAFRVSFETKKQPKELESGVDE
jgi:hypothetical protein